MGNIIRDILVANGTLEDPGRPGRDIRAAQAGVAAVVNGPATLPAATIQGAVAGASPGTATTPSGLAVVDIGAAGHISVAPPSASNQIQIHGLAHDYIALVTSVILFCPPSQILDMMDSVGQ